MADASQSASDSVEAVSNADVRSGRRAPEPRILIVIPTLNEVRHVERLIEELRPSLSAGVRGLLVVVDGGSSDGTAQVALELARRHDDVQCMHNPARIQSAGLNLAARRFGQDVDVLIRCDAHAEYPPSFCRRLLESLERSGADAVVVPMDSVGESPLERAIAWVSNSIIGTGGSAHRGGTRSGFVDHGHHAAFRMDTFRRVGGYDESFSHNEDAEFDCRQHVAGAQVFLDATIRVRYRPRGTWRALAHQYFAYGGGRSRTVRLHPGSVRLRQLVVPGHILLSGLAVLLSPWSPIPLLWPTFYVGALAAASLYYATRYRSVDGLLAGPAAGVMHIAWGSGFIMGLLRGRDAKWRPSATRPLWPRKEELLDAGS